VEAEGGLRGGSLCGAQGWLALWGSGVALWGSGVALWGWVPTPLMRGSTSQAVPWQGECRGQSPHLGAAGFAGVPWWGPWDGGGGAGGFMSEMGTGPGWGGGDGGSSCRGVGGYGRRLAHC